MKHLLAIVLALSSALAMARENIVIYYSWTPADTAANFHRTLAAEANISLLHSRRAK